MNSSLASVLAVELAFETVLVFVGLAYAAVVVAAEPFVPPFVNCKETHVATTGKDSLQRTDQTSPRTKKTLNVNNVNIQISSLMAKVISSHTGMTKKSTSTGLASNSMRITHLIR